VPWNKGRFIGPKPPLKPKQVWAIRLHLQREERLRDLAMFDLAVDSKLRGCDLVRLRTGQLVVNATVRQRATTIQRKTEKPVQFEMTEQTRDSLLAWLIHRGGSPDDYVFPSRVHKDRHLSTRQYAASSATASRRSGSAGQPTAPTACAGPRSRSSTSEPAT
jgi:integrase